MASIKLVLSRTSRAERRDVTGTLIRVSMPDLVTLTALRQQAKKRCTTSSAADPTDRSDKSQSEMRLTVTWTERSLPFDRSSRRCRNRRSPCSRSAPKTPTAQRWALRSGLLSPTANRPAYNADRRALPRPGKPSVFELIG